MLSLRSARRRAPQAVQYQPSTVETHLHTEGQKGKIESSMVNEIAEINLKALDTLDMPCTCSALSFPRLAKGSNKKELESRTQTSRLLVFLCSLSKRVGDERIALDYL